MCSGLGYHDVRSIIEVLPDDGYEVALPTQVDVEGRLLSFDRGERSLIHVLSRADDAVVILSDEDAFDLVKHLVEIGNLGVYPIASLAFTRAMYQCRALPASHVMLVCEQVLGAVEAAPSMSQSKRSRKEQDVRELTAYVALEEARRSHRRQW
jgi:hypothetical protein